MQIDLNALGNIGEFVAAVGVIVTLVYLAAQVRQNTASVRAATYHAIVESYAAFSSLVGQDSEVARVLQAGLSQPSELSEADEFRFNFLMLSAARRWENAFYQHEHSMLHASQSQGLQAGTLLLLTSPGGRTWWGRFGHHYSSEFREWVESTLDDDAQKPGSGGSNHSE